MGSRALLKSTVLLGILFLVALGAKAQCAPSGTAGTVNICTPTANATVSSPVSFAAAATPVAGRTITAMRLYVDSVSKITVNSNTLSTSVALANGTHSVVVNAWDNTGAVIQKIESITVTTSTGSCTPTASVVTICSPTTGATVASPVNFQAVAGAPSGQTITAMKLYIDSIAKFQSASGTLSTSQAIANGLHSITINAWTNTGTVLKASETITVGSTPPGVSISVAPVSISVAANATQQFTATVTGTTNLAVTWSVDGVEGGSAAAGTITSTGVYAAPGTAGTHQVKATSQADTTKSATATVNVFSGSSCSPIAGKVTICQPSAGATVPSPVTIQGVAGAPSGQSITAMKVYIDGVSKFQTSSGSLLTSLTLSAGSHLIGLNAWTNTGTVIKASESITVSSTPPPPGISISPASAFVKVSGTQQFKATVTGFSDTSVTWSVDGATGGSGTAGTISSTGLYTAPSTEGNHTVTATSNADSTKSASAAVTVETTPPPSSGGVFTYMYNNSRTGLNSSETELSVAAVTNGSNFGHKGSWTLDGTIQTQPLYVPDVSVGSGTFNVVYVATENDSVYALNADTPGQVLWKRNLIPSGGQVGYGYAGGRTSLGSRVGITGTPVIDEQANRIYVLAKTYENSQHIYRLHVLDLRDGSDAVPAKVLQASVSGTGDGSSNGTLDFSSFYHNHRSGIVLSNGILYLVFASYGDNIPYHGWVMALNASDLSMIDSYVSTPNTDGGGIWAAGAAPAIDSDGNLYVTTANQMPNASGFPNIPIEIPNSVLKLKLVSGKLTLVDYFTPYNTKCLTNDDLDLGSSTPVLIPQPFGGHNILALGSKEGRAYLVDRDNMGKYHSGSDSQILSSVLFNPLGACGTSGFNASTPWRVYGTPAYWNGNIYFGSAFGKLRQYNITNATLQLVALGSHTYAASGQSGRGPLTVVSSDGSSNAIVWTAENDLSSLGWLRAYDATNVSKQLYSNNFGSGSNFVIPTVINGKVFVSGKATLHVYGLLH